MRVPDRFPGKDVANPLGRLFVDYFFRTPLSTKVRTQRRQEHHRGRFPADQGEIPGSRFQANGFRVARHRSTISTRTLLNSTENRDFQRVVRTMATDKFSEFSAVRVVVFDFGFTLWNEERVWNNWASWLRVPPLEFFAILGSVIERGEHHHHAFEVVCPGFDVSRERQRRGTSGESDSFRPDELYPDVIPCLKELRAAGYRTGVAGNFVADFTKTLRAMNAPLDFIGSSEEWGLKNLRPNSFPASYRYLAHPPGRSRM